MARGRNHNGVPRRVQRFSGDNQMNTHNLAIVFGPTLFQTDGKDYKAGRVVEDLISHYVKIFNVGLNAQNSSLQSSALGRGEMLQGPLAPACADTWMHQGWLPRDGGSGRKVVPPDPWAPLLGRSTTKR